MAAEGDVTPPEAPVYGAQIRRYRLAEGLSVPQLAARAGLHPNALRRIEGRRTSVPHAETRARLAEALGLSRQQREQLEQQLRSTSPAALLPTVPFVGREPELHLIRRHLDATGPPLLLFHGEPGIGKTTLLTRAAALGIERGMRALPGGSGRWRGEQSPYSPLAEALETALLGPHDRVRRDLAGCEWLCLLLPQLLEAPFHLPRCQAPPGRERYLISRAVLRFLLQGAGRRGTLLVLDDLHWAGGDALALLVDLLRDAPADRLRVIGAYRENEAPPGSLFATTLADLAHAGLAVQRLVDPLSDVEAGSLLDALMGEAQGIDGRTRSRILQRSDGVPFYLVNFGFAIREGRAPVKDSSLSPTDASSHGERPDELLPWTIAQSVHQRLASLSPRAREVVTAIAITGTAHRSLLSALVHLGPEKLVAPLEEAQRAGLLQEAGAHSYRVEHEVMREAIVGALSTARRAALHLQIAAALEQGRAVGIPAAPAEIARHFLEAGDPARALPYLLRAGDEAEAVFAHHEAEHHYAQALHLAHRLASQGLRAEAWERLGAVRAATARYDDAIADFERAIQLHRESGHQEAEAEVTARLARVSVLAGTPGEGRRRAEQMVAHLGENGAPRSLAYLHAARAECLQREGEHALELEAAQAAVTHAGQIQDERLLAEVLTRQGIALEMLHRLPEAKRILAAAVPRLERLGSLETLAVACRELGWMCLCVGDFDEGRRYRKRAVRAAETLQDPARTAVELANLAMADIVGGFWQEADDGLQRAITLARSVGTPPAVMYPLFVAGVLALLRGMDWAQAEAYLGECGAIALQAGDVAMAWQVQWALAERDLFTGDAEQALARFTAFGGIKRYREMNAGDAPYLLRVFAALNAAVGRLDDAEGLIELAIRGSEEEQDRLHLVEAFRVYGQIRAAQGRLAEAKDLLSRARNVGEQTRYCFGEARALHGLGLVCAAQSETAEARAHLAEAHGIFTRVGATKNAERVAETLGQLARSTSLEPSGPVSWLARF